MRTLEIRLALWGMQQSAETNAWIKVQLYLAHASIMFVHAKGMDIHFVTFALGCLRRDGHTFVTLAASSKSHKCMSIPLQ